MGRAAYPHPEMPGVYILPLTKGFHALVDEIDAAAASEFNWFTITKRNYGGRHLPRENGKCGPILYLHRFIGNRMGLIGDQVDHRSRDNVRDCRRDNLRGATIKENTRNGSLRSTNTSGYKGVIWEKRQQKWVARITVDDKQIHLGTFEDPKIASDAYDQAAEKYFGEFAAPNSALARSA